MALLLQRTFNYGYKHAPRAARDVREAGIPLETHKVKSTGGKSIAAYKFRSLTQLQPSRSGGRLPEHYFYGPSSAITRSRLIQGFTTAQKTNLQITMLLSLITINLRFKTTTSKQPKTKRQQTQPFIFNSTYLQYLRKLSFYNIYITFLHKNLQLFNNFTNSLF